MPDKWETSLRQPAGKQFKLPAWERKKVDNLRTRVEGSRAAVNKVQSDVDLVRNQVEQVRADLEKLRIEMEAGAYSAIGDE